MKIAFYLSNFNSIGGVETWLYNIGKIYGENHNIYVYYTSGDSKQLDRIRPLVKLRQFNYQRVECDIAIFCYTTNDEIIKCFNSKERIQFIHACYSLAYHTNKYTPSKYIDRFIAVSKVAADDFYNITGIMPEVMYNPVYVEKPKKLLKLISATRISEDKGSIWQNMKKLANKLNEVNIPFIWLVFTYIPTIEPVKNVVFLPPNLNLSDYIKEADYLVQLSKTEAFCYSILESLSLGTPVLCTNFPATKELGVVNGKTGYVFDMDMSNVDIDKIYNNIPKVDMKILNSNDKWNKLLGESIKVEKDKMVKVKCVFQDGFYDNECNKYRKKNEVWETTYERASDLEYHYDSATFTNYHLIDIIE